MITVPKIPELSPDPSQPSVVHAMAYGSTGLQESDLLYRVERGTPRYRLGRLIAVFPQFRAQKMYVRNTNSVPTNIPLTQASPATSPFLNTTTGRVTYPVSPVKNANAPDLP